MKNNITYYRHETNSHNHWKFKKLRRKYQFAGEGRFWILNNHIAESENCKLDLSNTDKLETLAADLDLDVVEFNEFLFYLVRDCKLVKQDENGMYYTDHVQEVLAEVMKKRERDRKLKAEKSLAKNEKSLAKGGSSYSEKQQSKVNENKVDVEEAFTPTSTEVRELFLLDIGLLNTWIGRGFLKEKFDNGIQTFINHVLKTNYKDLDDLRKHFVCWMPHYPKASQTVPQEANGIPQPKISFK